MLFAVISSAIVELVRLAVYYSSDCHYSAAGDVLAAADKTVDITVDVKGVFRDILRCTAQTRGTGYTVSADWAECNLKTERAFRNRKPDVKRSRRPAWKAEEMMVVASTHSVNELPLPRRKYDQDMIFNRPSAAAKTRDVAVYEILIDLQTGKRVRVALVLDSTLVVISGNLLNPTELQNPTGNNSTRGNQRYHVILKCMLRRLMHAIASPSASPSPSASASAPPAYEIGGLLSGANHSSRRSSHRSSRRIADRSYGDEFS